MTITFPRAFPLDGCFSGACSFELAYQQSQALTGGASPNVADLGPAYWIAAYSTDAMSREDLGIWQAWFASLRGGLRTFKGRPALWKWPQAYPRGFAGLTYSGSPFTGSGNLSAIATERDAITINELPLNFVLKAGDYLSIPAGTKQHIHRVTEGATGGASSVTVGIEPIIRPGIVTGIDVLLEAPYCEMVLTGPPSISRQGTRGGSISFNAQQVLI